MLLERLSKDFDFVEFEKFNNLCVEEKLQKSTYNIKHKLPQTIVYFSYHL